MANNVCVPKVLFSEASSAENCENGDPRKNNERDGEEKDGERDKEPPPPPPEGKGAGESSLEVVPGASQGGWIVGQLGCVWVMTPMLLVVFLLSL